MKTAYIGVSDYRNIDKIRSWLESQGYVIQEGEPDLEEDYSIVIVNMPYDLPYNEDALLSFFKDRDAYVLLKSVLNYRESIPVCDPEDYDFVIESHEICGDVTLHDRRKLAVKALLHLLSFFSRIHSKMAELFAMLDFEHRIYRVVDRIFSGETVKEVLLDTLYSISNVKPLRNLPIYISIFNEIPNDSFLTLEWNAPSSAGYGRNFPDTGDVLIYKGVLKERVSGYRIIVAVDGPDDVIGVKPSTEDVFYMGSNGIHLKWERTFNNMANIERLAHAFVAFSPNPTSAVFNENEGLIAFKRDFKAGEHLLDLPPGDVLATNFDLWTHPKSSYRSLVVPNILEGVKDSLRSSRLVLRRF